MVAEYVVNSDGRLEFKINWKGWIGQWWPFEKGLLPINNPLLFAQPPTATDQILNEWLVIGTAFMALPMVDATMNEHVAEDNAADDGWIEETVAHDADDVHYTLG